MGKSLMRKGTLGMLGALVTLGLFVFMAYLVKQPPAEYQQPTPTPALQVTMPDRVDPRPDRQRTPPPIPEPIKPIAIATGGGDPNGTLIETPTIELPPVQPTGQDFGNNNFDAVPVVQIQPNYPISAAQNGKEGFVVLGFDIAADGSTTNIRVLDANPKRTFDAAARDAVKRWKYKPRMVDGKPVAVSNQQIRLDFSLDQRI
ncbi:energy transducer TonB [Shewanella khirikhana]|uniref:Transport protein TonB n=1 Tax=Shewanella khirikhana TaxID=1965282 RepID=A0ABM7DRX9_9GAMM|nr:energy transducer TonB [Shewanella khirikhana]AZQ12458.1 transport protein TonB [Shewanella khirikhana]